MLWLIIIFFSYIVVSIIIGAIVSATIDERLGEFIFLVSLVILLFVLFSIVNS
ncbi:hypothetical protein HMPREF0345_0005 [Enterococcus faecalis ATCC 29200]|uniref:Uncharacterized protein n=1 Tax=Enterococcus faecalis TX0630 TaxID=749508 RepID=A0ABC9P332_ENTFL|nr:hypothetical protein [Enterococcus faecalis]EEN73048.1 hypothetical protein HMPREF0345_0005 [Enterococcus faecalis ATCC 29200]EFU89371.1 hypothetical protein HMPREF9511_02655 [Enterococcus faecalis TX0630]